MKKEIGIIALAAIIVLFFFACSRNNAQAPDVSAAAQIHSSAAYELYEGGPGDDYEAQPPGFSDPHAKNTDRDLSESPVIQIGRENNLNSADFDTSFEFQKEVNALNAQQETSLGVYSPKSITITGIPEYLNGLYCSMSLVVVDANGWYNYAAWSEPVIVKNGSATNIFFAYINSEKSKEPFYKDGIYNVLVSIDDLNSYSLPHWQGSNSFIIADETSIIYWSDFSEVFG